tara:strand:+ start:143 stop:1252 length:1110 start_codon:yes stop_codon:yes gene_type:complete
MTKINVVKNKSIQTLNGKTINLDVDKCTVKPQFTELSPYLGRTIIDWNDVYVPDVFRGQVTNTIRKGGNVDSNRVSELVTDFDNNGIRYEEPVIAIYYEPIFINGRHYNYQIKNVGNHRAESHKNLSIASWIFDVYMPADKWSNEDIGWISNNSKSNVKPLSKASMITSLVKMVKGERWGKLSIKILETKLSEYIKTHASSNLRTIESIIKQVLHKTNTDTDHRDYLPEQAEKFVEQVVGVEVNGVFDEDTDKYHWVVGEGYETTKIMKALHKFSETGKHSDFYFHTKQPLSSSTKRTKDTTYKKRLSMKKAHDITLDVIEKAVVYKQTHGNWPLNIRSYLPHDAIHGEDMDKMVEPNMALTKPTKKVA